MRERERERERERASERESASERERERAIIFICKKEAEKSERTFIVILSICDA